MKALSSINSISIAACFSEVIIANNSFECEKDIALPFESLGAPNHYMTNSFWKKCFKNFFLANISFCRLFIIDFSILHKLSIGSMTN